mmetsp:Transcript_61460/g.174587  ORF Transcript_61460/g.174587 Transcript_61460/m.174587 type:complete len:405 (-) Transcript_61460:127-1341(-)
MADRGATDALDEVERAIGALRRRELKRHASDPEGGAALHGPPFLPLPRAAAAVAEDTGGSPTAAAAAAAAASASSCSGVEAAAAEDAAAGGSASSSGAPRMPQLPQGLDVRQFDEHWSMSNQLEVSQEAQLRVAGAGGTGASCNGLYRAVGRHVGRPKYQHTLWKPIIKPTVPQPIIYYTLEGWKINDRDDTTSCMYFHTDAHSKTPPELDWRTIGPHRGDADPPPTISYVQAGDAGTTHNDVGTAGGLQAQPAGANGGLLEYFWFWFSTSLRLDSAGLGVLYTVLHIRGQDLLCVSRVQHGGAVESWNLRAIDETTVGADPRKKVLPHDCMIVDGHRTAQEQTAALKRATEQHLCVQLTVYRFAHWSQSLQDVFQQHPAIQPAGWWQWPDPRWWQWQASGWWQ